MKTVMKQLGLAVLSLAVASLAVAAAPTQAPPSPTAVADATGQPNQSCEDTPNQPGQSSTAPGSAFNPEGTAGGVYAGEQPQNSKNPKSVSQYDTACARPAHN